MTIANGKKGSEEAEPGEDESEAEAVTCRPGKRGGAHGSTARFCKRVVVENKISSWPKPARSLNLYDKFP